MLYKILNTIYPKPFIFLFSLPSCFALPLFDHELQPEKDHLFSLSVFFCWSCFGCPSKRFPLYRSQAVTAVIPNRQKRILHNSATKSFHHKIKVTIVPTVAPASIQSFLSFSGSFSAIVLSLIQPTISAYDKVSKNQNKSIIKILPRQANNKQNR